MRQALHESQMIPLVSSYLAQTKNQENRTAEIEVRFPTVQENSDEFIFTTYSLPTMKSPTRHEVVEVLLRGPTYEALSDGAVTYIPTGTRLIGLTVSQGIAFIDLSSEFLRETPWEQGTHELKIEQLRKTMLGDPEIRDIVLLIEGELLKDVINKPLVTD